MGKSQDRTVYYQLAGDKWANKRNDASRASSIHFRQIDAVRAAKDMLRRFGGGELTIMNKNGRLRDKYTVSPDNDPFSATRRTAESRRRNRRF
ncbi:MAG: DUF2188 domain-containing protein [Gammaproteobacteria bacterium]|nr:DUF2188 domain-containing protein [Gammaproteobacteria bacterium]MDA7971915.1 DUF2188 domain-containing protein [Gammaproteobacteria bacterium]MDA8011513.1 DUF2188 domain-containing protein [Gammaproteobacteria bacterium]